MHVIVPISVISMVVVSILLGGLISRKYFSWWDGNK